MSKQNLNESDDDLFNQMSNAISKGESLNHLFDEDDSSEIDPIEESGEEEVEENEGEEPSNKENSPEDEWINSLPEDAQENVRKLKQAHDEYAHKVGSMEGRLHSYNRLNLKHRDAKREIDSLRAKLEEVSKPRESIVAALEINSDEDFKDLLESDPTFANMFERQLQKVASKLEEDYSKRISDFGQALANREQENAFDSERNRVLEAIPNAEEVWRSKEWGEFKKVLTAEGLELYESGRADDMINLMYGYGEYLKAKYPSQPETNEKPATGEGNSGKADLISEERQRKLKGGPGVDRSKPTGQVPLKDEQDLFNEMYKQIRKESGFT